MGNLDIPPLAGLSPTAHQDYQFVTVTAEIDSVAWADVNAVFQYAATDASNVGQIASLHTGECRPHSYRCAHVEIVKPTTERAATAFVDVLSDLDHNIIVTLTLLSCKMRELTFVDRS